VVQIKLQFYGNVTEDGKLVIDNREGFDDYVTQFSSQKIRINISRLKDSRSSNQNRYYWGVLIPVFADYFGMTNEETHEALKWEHLKKTIIDHEGNPRQTVRSTASMKTDGFEEYMTLLRRWGAMQFGLNIPEPNEVPFW